MRAYLWPAHMCVSFPAESKCCLCGCVSCCQHAYNFSFTAKCFLILHNSRSFICFLDARTVLSNQYNGKVKMHKILTCTGMERGLLASEPSTYEKFNYTHGSTSNGNRHASKQPMPIPNFEPNLLAITEQGALPIIIWNCLLRRQLISLLGY
ncbi:uncharacterized protein LOC115767285 [Drosophila novamexicana]|uniref:uncharacterized protein LOC115767285 n=1 Tax=Drosophila novamexicana TaxID=47314 RepID=UPI0011E5B19B|nr:uncharacterized protein LOC115767285 [Drosophila novamexicana]